jgi:hypothetical protein
VIGKRIKRALSEEALAQGSKGATLSNAVLQKEWVDFSLRREGAGAAYPYYDEHVQAIKRSCEYLQPNIRQRNTGQTSNILPI